mgnify:FL=1
MAKPIAGGLNSALFYGVKLGGQTVAQKLGETFGLAAALGLATATALAKPELSGELLYAKLCANCHGEQGQGVPDEHDEPLAGDWPIEKLSRVITRTMPDDDPKKCIGDEAQRVARYIFDAFYSPDARLRNKPPRIGLVRLTNRQYLHSVADLIGSFIGRSELGQAGGLKASYHNSRNHSRNKNSIERTDATVDFQYGESTPAPDNREYKAEEFSMRWSGSVIAEETGDHKFIVTSENGVRLWVNDMNLKLIEGWVSSGETRELTGTLRLIGGRAYPLRLDFFKYKSSSASIKLEWHPPHGARQVIPARSLSPASTRNTFVLRQPFPPDDSSAGYERGSAVSKKWDEATTLAAIEMANLVADRIDPLAGTSPDDAQRDAKVHTFCNWFVERTFRRPLTPEQQQFFIDSRFAEGKPATDSVKEVVLLALKSPRFLYPDLGQADDHAVAARLALGLWDSIPDDELLRAADAGRLGTPSQARQQALRMLRAPRSRAKLRDTFHHWLGLDHAEEIAKDTEQYPNYDKSLEADLRTSLNTFLDNIVWRTAGADFRKLLNSRHLPFNERLARFYGAQRVKHHGEFGPSFFDHERAGLLTHPYLLALYSYHNATSPIHRGVFITRHVLGRSLKPPPEAAVFKDEAFAPNMTMREKVTQLTKADACMTCHGIINPLGFALEQFDGIGRLRDTEKGRPINTISDYLSADGSAVRLTSAGDLARHATKSPSAQNGFIEMLFNQVAKQPVRAYGSGFLNRLRGDFAASGFNVQFLLAETAVINAMNGIDPALPIERN